jgi:hypothetical protein|tara:strand:- start:64 stop:948 length:885 start_codon:yes stop_codon:yes gene_type:complete
MPIIYTYPSVTPTADDLILLSDLSETEKPTRSATIGNVLALGSTSITTLNNVTELRNSNAGSLDVKTTNGKIDIDATTGDVDIKTTTSGGVNVKPVGDIVMEPSAGKVEIKPDTTCEIVPVTGNVQLKPTAGKVEIKPTVEAIELETVGTKKITMIADNGDIALNTTGTGRVNISPSGDVKLFSQAGDVYVKTSTSTAADGKVLIAKDAEGKVEWTNTVAAAFGGTGNNAPGAFDILVGRSGSYSLSSAMASAMQLPAGTTAQRPGSPVNGMLRYNSDTSKIEAYAGGAWVDLH